MPQPPFQVDALQVEPGSGQTLLIERDASTGAVKITDNVMSGGVLLYQLAGLQSIGNVLVVGTTGVGAQYTTIQSALDAIPSTASPTNPYLVLVLPGVYEGTLNIVRDGVRIVGIGAPVIQEGAANDDHTVVISAQLGTTPQQCVLQGLRITNGHTNKACLRIVGAAATTLLGGGQGLQLRQCRLEANAAGGNRPIWGTAANSVLAEECTFGGSVQALCLFEEMSAVTLRSCAIPNGLSFRYDTANDEPADSGGTLKLSGCEGVGSATALSPAVVVDCAGAGGSELHNVTMAPTSRLQYSGDREHIWQNVSLGVLSLLETASVAGRNATLEGILAANANAELRLDSWGGVEAFSADTSVSVVFDVPQPDADYMVTVEVDARPVNDETPWVTNKTAAGFDIEFNTAQTLDARWRAER